MVQPMSDGAQKIALDQSRAAVSLFRRRVAGQDDHRIILVEMGDQLMPLLHRHAGHKSADGFGHFGRHIGNPFGLRAQDQHLQHNPGHHLTQQHDSHHCGNIAIQQAAHADASPATRT
jgi:hypothetical protein